jgi:photosystem II stability/assembly factor-like uncharacterized protein
MKNYKSMPFIMAFVLMFAVATAIPGIAQEPKIPQPKLTPQNSGTTQLLISVSPVNSKVVWAAGAGGTYVVTNDGGSTWKAAVVPGAEKLQFRDVQGVSDKIAYLLSVPSTTGPTDFRIYKTEDGGATWKIEFTNHNKNAFYDCFAFWGPNRGIAQSDSVNGVFPTIRTTDGTTWKSISSHMPKAQEGEAQFAASGTCVATQGEENAWIATGGAKIARILATTDGATAGMPMTHHCGVRPLRAGSAYPSGTLLTALWAGATWPRTNTQIWQRRMMAAVLGHLQTNRRFREPFSA